VNKKRLHLIDLVRLFSFTAIIHYHVISQIYTDTYAEPYDAKLHAGTLFGYIAEATKPFSFSGFSIIILSFFLFGRQTLSPQKTRRLYVLLALGTVFLLVTGLDNSFSGIFWEWDIYEYLIVAIASVLLLQRHPFFLKVCGILGFLLTWIPFYLLADNAGIPLVVRSIFFGVCDNEGRGGWALLPWIGLAWFSFYLGTLSVAAGLREKATRMQKNEKLFWGAALLASVFYWGEFYHVPLDQNFYCFVFRRTPVVFWAHLIWIFFFIRLSLVEKINARLHENRVVRWLSGLRLSTHFGLCYLLHLLYLFGGSYFADDFKVHLFAYDMFVLSVLPVTEIMARGVLYCASLKRPKRALVQSEGTTDV